MSEIQGTGIINELVMTIPVGSKPRYLNKVMSGSVMDFGDLLDGEGEELY